MEIKVLFFGIIADVTSKNEIVLSDIQDTNSLEKELIKTFPDIAKYSYLISVNQKIVKEKQELQNNDEIALLPPFAGG